MDNTHLFAVLMTIKIFVVQFKYKLFVTFFMRLDKNHHKKNVPCFRLSVTSRKKLVGCRGDRLQAKSCSLLIM